jgi:amino acid transporter
MGDAVAKAGPGGTALALLIGGLGVLLVAFCYAEMAARLPAAGGELVYAQALGGSGAAYSTGWTLALVYTAACAFQAISIGQLLALLFPGIEGPVAYHILGQDVRLGSLVIGAALTIGFYVIAIRGVRGSAVTQEWITYLRILLMVGFLAIAIWYADPANLLPLIPGETSKVKFWAFVSMLGTAPFWFAGFNSAATASEECSTSMASAGRALILAVVGSAVFYIMLVLSVSALVPVSTLMRLPIPAAQAFEISMGTPIVAKIVLITAILGSLSAWNALLLAGSRVYFALGRASLSPTSFAQLNIKGAPNVAIGLMTVATLLAMMLGKGFILPIVNIISVCFGVTYVATCLAVLKLRKTGEPSSYVAPGGTMLVMVAVIFSATIAIVAFVQPLYASGGQVPPEWITLGSWCMVSTAFWIAARGNIKSLSNEQRMNILRGKGSS